MFDFFDTSKLLIIGVVALIVIPPKDLPSVLRQVGQAVGKLRRMAADFQSQFKDALAEADIESLKKDLQSVSDAAKIELDTAIGTPQQAATVEPTPEPVLEPAPPAAEMIAEKPKRQRKATTADDAVPATKPKRAPAKKSVKADV